ncbi:hypothetical protein [Amycolatopsis sp. NBC_01286]|uniref:hypothetical protein n=1 Tax=Amycolatopsis sp. NBC_01286 TaxID=2903560 RepID=UPI002E136584|nr:hypothetical protein OG570_48100 [Amycolatopsis sp. NBC_01286]
MTPPASAAGGAPKPAARRPRATTAKAPPAAAPARRGRHGSEDEPKHRQLMRRDMGLWPDQVAELLTLRDQVNHARTQRDERITDATLVRVAVDLLGEFREHLAGNTEDELRDSVAELARELLSHPTTVQRAQHAVATAKTKR